MSFIGLIYSGLYLIYVVATNIGASFTLMLIPFSILFLVLGYGIWRRNRFAFVGSVIISAFFVLFFGSLVPGVLGNPSDFTVFFGVSSVFFALITTIVYSALGAKAFWRKGAAPSLGKAIPRSSFFALIMVGFIVGALVAGAFAGATESRLLGNLGKTADIIIVQGAGNRGNSAGYFSPSNFTAKVGVAVIWSNGDGATHTVTSTPSGAFDSGMIAPGATWEHHFTAPGTYAYHCIPHPWMKGVVKVTGTPVAGASAVTPVTGPGPLAAIPVPRSAGLLIVPTLALVAFSAVVAVVAVVLIARDRRPSVTS